MDKLKIYSVSDKYISFLRSDPELAGFVFDNKLDARVHTRKYLGAVLSVNGFSYFIPFSSAKPSDYIKSADGTAVIRKSTVTIVRMTCKNTKTGAVELKGTLKINNMIPVPPSELTYYDISSETDAAYKDLVSKEYRFITANGGDIIKKAEILYSQQRLRQRLLDKTPRELSQRELKILEESPNYLNFTVPFQYAEQKCMEFGAVSLK